MTEPEQPARHGMIRILRFSILLIPLFLVGCDLFSSDEPTAPETVMLSFRIEATSVPERGWVYWYVNDRTLRYLPGESFGPIGVMADCGSHAGIAAVIGDGPGAPDSITLVIETIEDEGTEPSVARETFEGAGEHQLVVLITCP